jgi:protein-disulfide isomerase
MKNIGLLLATIVGSLVLIIGIAFFFSKSTTTSSTGQTAQPEPQEVVVSDGALSVGPADAKVTIVEFSDFQCPSCKAVSPLIKQVLAQYPNDVRLVYRHYPLVSIHPYAQIAAQASEAAAEQNKFWEFHDVLFEKQAEWSQLSSQGQVEAKFVEYAGQLGIDTAQFRERITADEVRKRVLDDVADAQKLSLSGTPSLFVNNQRVPAPGQLLTTVQSLVSSQE